MFTEAEKANALAIWSRTSAPPHWLVAGTLKEEIEAGICTIIDSEMAGDYSQFNLGDAARRLVEKTVQQNQAEQSNQRWFLELKNSFPNYPNFIQSDHTWNEIEKFRADNPAATVGDWWKHASAHNDDARLWVGAKALDFVALVRVADKNRLAELRQIYGTKIDEALDELKKRMRGGADGTSHKLAEAGIVSHRERESWRGDDAQTRVAKEAKAKREAEANPETQKRALEQAESLANSASAGPNHADTKRLRESLKAIRVTDSEGNAIGTATLAAREQAYRDWGKGR